MWIEYPRVGSERAGGGVHVVVVVSALEGLPDALDAESVVFERVQAAGTGEVGCRLGRQAADAEAGRHEAVADRGVVAAAVGDHAEVGGVAVGVVGDAAVDGEGGVVGAGGDDD